MTIPTSHISRRLGRDPRRFDLSPVHSVVAGCSAIVSGGGGSIGAALSLALCRFGAREVVPLDACEHALANLLSAAPSDAGGRLKEAIANVRDPNRLNSLARRFAPEIVFHAAALKHIHLGDRHPTECVLTNLAGMRNMLNAAEASGAAQFVFISSDKAAAPTSVMGACKRLAEIYLNGRNARSTSTRSITVRFGNVLGSQGSVVEVFDRQIAMGGPVTLTHRDMRRYFMTIDEAVALILLAVSRAPGVNDTASYLLEMGAPVKIMHLAQCMIEASGRDIAIIETGAREGEKFDEELYDEHETLHHTGIEGLLAIRSRTVRTVTDADIDRLEEIALSGDETEARSAVFELVHECLVGCSKPNASSDTETPHATQTRAHRAALPSERPG